MSLGKELAARRKANRRKIEVPAWSTDEETFVIYAGALTCRDVEKIQRKHKDFINNPTVEAMVDLIIQKAEDANGDKLFTLEDKAFLMDEELTVISEIAGVFGETVSVEEAEKN